MKKNGFTLVELLAVIVILAIILVIAVPKIMDTINSARKSAIESTGKLIINSAEKEWLSESVSSDSTKHFSTAGVASCSVLTDMSSSDYDTDACTVTVGTDGKVTALTDLKGAESGKFAGYTCTYASNTVTCTK